MNRIDIALSLLEEVERSKKEYDKLWGEAIGIRDSEEACDHPPLTKKGKHNLNYPCHDCYNRYDQLIQETWKYEGWGNAWAFVKEREES